MRTRSLWVSYLLDERRDNSHKFILCQAMSYNMEAHIAVHELCVIVPVIGSTDRHLYIVDNGLFFGRIQKKIVALGQRVFHDPNADRS